MNEITPKHEDMDGGKSGAADPLVKWPGGKRWLAPMLSAVFRDELDGTYYEPFIGGGAVFLALRPQRAVLSDVNSALIECLNTVRKNPKTVLRALRRWTNTKTCYYQVRALAPRTDVTEAARLIYLTKTCWGGIFRLNRQGVFNVPFGDSGRTICRASEFRMAAGAFRRAKLLDCDFECAIDKAQRGDVVYADPPYTTLGQNNGFIRYNEHLFAWKDQERLAETGSRARRRGVFVAVSGLWHDSVLSLYPGWWAIRLDRMSTVSCDLKGRRKVSEVVIFSRRPKALWDNTVRLTVMPPST